MIHFRATGRAAYARTDEPLTTGSVGIPVDVSLSSDFDGLQSVVVFRSGDVTADVALLGQDVVVPPQVLTGRVLSMGVFASSTDGTTVIPTVWCDVGLIRGSAATEFDPAEPTPGWSAQIQSWAEDAADSAVQAMQTADSIRADMDEFNETSAVVLDDVRAATTAANEGAANANGAAEAATSAKDAANVATENAIEATSAARTATTTANDAATLAMSAAGTANTAATNADIATAAARQATAAASEVTTVASAVTSAAQAATVNANSATAAAQQATSDAITATGNANIATAAASDATDAANSAANAANSAANAANSAAAGANGAATYATTAATTANDAAATATNAAATADDATDRANAAIAAMGDISELAVPLMSADVRGGAKLGDGLEIADGALSLQMTGEGTEVKGTIASLTAKGWATQDGTPTPDAPVEIKVARGRKNFLDVKAIFGNAQNYYSVNADGSVRCLASDGRSQATSSLFRSMTLNAGTYVYSRSVASGSFNVFNVATGTTIASSATDSVTFTLQATTTVAFKASYNGTYPVTMFLTLEEVDSNGYADINIQGKNLLSDVAEEWAHNTVHGPNCSTASIPVEDGKSYHYHCKHTGTGLIAYWHNAGDGTSQNIATLTSYSNYTFTNSGGWTHLLLVHSGTLDVKSIKTRELIIERGDTFTGYEPYFHRVIHVPMPSKGYAAALPNNADILTIDGAGKWEWTNNTGLADLGEQIWTQYTGTDNDGKDHRFMSYSVPVKGSSRTTSVGTFLTSRFAKITASYMYDGGYGFATYSKQVFVRIENVLTVEALVSWFATHPTKALYPLFAPTTESGYVDLPDIPSDATITCKELDALGVRYFIGNEISTLASQWHDRIAYERTIATQDALASVAPIEHNPAESNHSVGELITYEGALYKVNAAIARGESITIGTNVAATTVAEQLAALQ